MTCFQLSSLVFFSSMVFDVAWYISPDSPRRRCHDSIKCARIFLGETPVLEKMGRELEKLGRVDRL